MLGLGFGEFLIVAIVLLVAVGPKRLPTLMRSVGRAVREFRRSAFELRQASGIDKLLQEDIETIRRPQMQVKPFDDLVAQNEVETSSRASDEKDPSDQANDEREGSP